MSTIKINPVIETIEIVKCDIGFIVYLHNGRGDVVSTQAVSTLGYAGYAGTAGSLLEVIQVALTPKPAITEGE